MTYLNDDQPCEATVYVEGYCKMSQGPGGWGVFAIFNETEHEMSGTEAVTTYNRMELTAVISALKAFAPGSVINVFSASWHIEMVVKRWIHRWKRSGWRTSVGKPIKNRSLWIRFDEAARQHNVTWQWGWGHDSNIGNERADGLAYTALQNFLD